MKALILAAGFGERLHPLTKNKSKCLLEVKGKPIIDYTLNKINEIEFIDKVFVLSNNKFYNDFSKWAKNKEKVVLLNNGVNSKEEIKGAVEDLLNVLLSEKFDDTLLLATGDNFFKFSLKDSYKIFQKEKKDVALFYDVGSFEDAKRFGIALIKNNVVVNFEEKPSNPKSTFSSAAIYFFKKETLNLLKNLKNKERKNDNLGFILEYLHTLVPIRVCKVSGLIDVGTPDSLKKARNYSKIEK